MTIWLKSAILAVSVIGAASMAEPGFAQSQTTSYTYDELGRLKTAVRPLGAATYTYDAAGNRTQVTQTTGAPPPPPPPPPGNSSGLIDWLQILLF